ncbi:MAG: hydroxyisourate hydrolase [Gemmatimonadaceae bacterium]
MISTHVLDTSRGRPAAGVAVTLEHLAGDAWDAISSTATDGDGRVRELLTSGTLRVGRYRLVFATTEYFARQGATTFYPAITIEFDVIDAAEKYHVPLLLSAFGYSTYRGS